MTTTKNVVRKKVVRRKVTVKKEWKNDLTFADTKRVPTDQQQDGWPKVDSRVLPGTFYRYNTSSNRVTSLVTIMPSGLVIGWDSCGRCKQYFRYCSCKAGIYHPRSVGSIRGSEDRPGDSGPTIAGSYVKFYDPYQEYNELGIKKSLANQQQQVLSKTPVTIPFAKPDTKSTPPPKRRNVLGGVKRPATVTSDVPEIDIKDKAAVDKAAIKSSKAKIAAVRKQLKGTAPRKRVVKRKKV